jgi:hypothetical protein
MTHEHLREIDPSTLSPTELRERLSWRDQHQPEVIAHERALEAQRRLDAQMQDAHEGYIAAGGDSADWPAVEQEMRDELVRNEARAQAEAARAESLRQMRANF